MYHIPHAQRHHCITAPAAVLLLALCLLVAGVSAANGPVDASALADANVTIEPTPLPAHAASALAPFPGPHPVPGTVEPQDFDLGGEGVAYHDTEPANLGGTYRPTEGVDIETVEGFTDVGWIRSGEWLTYTVTATTPQTVVLWLRFANPDATSKRVTILTNGTVAGTVDLRSTGSFEMYGDSSSTPFSLPAGETAVRLSFDGVERVNLDLLTFAPPPTPEPTPMPEPEPELRISTPGIHTLDGDLSATSSIGVLITGSDVVLDGMGHCIEGTDADFSRGVIVGGISPDPLVVNVTVRNLTVRHWETGIEVMRANGTVIEGVVAEQNGAGLRHGGDEFFPSVNGVVRDSVFRNNTAAGIDLSYPFGGITVERCEVTGNREGMSAACWRGQYDSFHGSPSLVADCDISGNQGYGLHIGEGWYPSRRGVVSAVRNCTIRDNGGDGVVVSRSTTTIVGNRIEENGGYGVNAGESGGSEITSNWIAGNRIGVSAGGDWPSRVRNNLLNNTDNGIFAGPLDSGYLNFTRMDGPNIVGGPYLGGNYWAFPNGTGFSQTHPDTDGDGFCDTPFVTASGAIDYLPLAMPAGAPVPGGTGRPTSTAGNGLYDDVNGNGRADFADVVLYFNQMSWIAANEPMPAFDYNGNARIDFADVVWLFNHL